MLPLKGKESNCLHEEQAVTVFKSTRRNTTFWSRYVYLFNIYGCCYYSGIFYALSVLGPAVAYIGGGSLLEIFTDFYSVGSERYVVFSDISQQTRGIDPMLFQCWPTVDDAGPTLNQHRVNVTYLLCSCWPYTAP